MMKIKIIASQLNTKFVDQFPPLKMRRRRYDNCDCTEYTPAAVLLYFEQEYWKAKYILMSVLSAGKY